jgi:hypothetical protein
MSHFAAPEGCIFADQLTLDQATSEDEVMSLAQFGPVTSQQDCILPLHDNNRFTCHQYTHFVALDEPCAYQGE